ncbi:murein biosynthesis integral membrane protein MurJ [Candidatus Peregrinibacteria bacterium]|nr:murein biosynthesis integral membrane protein MurJ [Candidatus Peregrinibacteria bacterium]
MKIRHLNVLPPTLLLALSALLSRFLGIVRDHLLAKTFGATAGTGIYNLDTYYAAFRIPDLLYNLLIFGAISAAFIPIFTQYKKDGKFKDAWEFASSMLHLMLIAILIIAGVTYALAPYLVHVVAGGFQGEQLALTVKLMRILLLSPIFFAVTSVFISIQDSFKTFLFRSLGPLFYNAGIIAGILLFAEKFGVIGVVWGVILGAGMNFLIQLPALRLVHFKHYWLLGHKRQDVKEAFRLILPRVFGLSVAQLTLIVNTLIASFLMTGSITIFYLSDNLQAVPLGMIGISFAITSFATLSELAGESDKEPFAMEIRRVMGQVLFLIIPATIGMLVLRHEIIDVILKYGKFSQSDALLTASVLGFLLISLFAQCLIPILGRGFYAYHNTKTPVMAGIIGSGISIGGSLMLAMGLNMGITGIAIAYSAGNIMNFAILYALMHRHLRIDIIQWGNVLKIILISTIMGSVIFMVKLLTPFAGTTFHQIGLLILYTATGLMIYMMLAAFLDMNEFKAIWRQIRRLKK